MYTHLRTAMTAAVSAALIIYTGGVATANPPDSIGDTIASAHETIGTTSQPTESMELIEDSLIHDAVHDIEIGANTDGDLAVTATDSGNELLIPSASAEEVGLEGQVVTAPSALNDQTSFAITPHSDGSVKVHSVIDGPSAPERFTYVFPDADFIVLDNESGIAMLFADVDGEYELVGGLDAPWAVDSTGASVPTFFEASGNRLTQVVEHRLGTYAYPIIADPSWWDNVKDWFKNAGSQVQARAKSAAHWLKSNSKWLAGKTWRVARSTVLRVAPGAALLCLAGGGWAWYRSDAKGWVRVGDTVAGCFG